MSWPGARRQAALLVSGVLSALVLVSRADEPPQGTLPNAAMPSTSTPGTPETAAPGARHRSPPRPRTAAQRLEDHIRRLAQVLDLDPGQQQSLRAILVDQQRQILALRARPGLESTDVATSTMAIYDASRQRIRAILNEAQQQKYSVDVPRGELGPARADLQHWMAVQEAARRQAPAGEDAQ